VSAELDTQTFSDRVDRTLQRFVGECLYRARVLVDEVMVMALGIGDLEPRDAIAAVEAMQQGELEQLVDHAIHRRRRPDTLRAQPIGDLLRAEQTLALAGQQLDHRRAHRARAQPCALHPLLGMRKPAIAKLRVHSRSLAQNESGSYSRLLHDREHAMVVAMSVVGVMEMISHQEIDVVAVWDRLVPAALAMHVIGVMPAAAVLWRAILRIRRVDLEHVLVDVVTVRVMKVAVVEIISVILVRYGQMTAARTVLMRMVGMDRVLTHAPEYALAPLDLQADGSEKRSQTAGRHGGRTVGPRPRASPAYGRLSKRQTRVRQYAKGTRLVSHLCVLEFAHGTLRLARFTAGVGAR